MIIAIGPAKITAKPPYGDENSANDDENDIEQKLNQYGTSATETKITARQKNSAVISRGRADRSPCKQESPLLARKRVRVWGICRPLRVRGTSENGRADTMFLSAGEADNGC